jgi:excisionase family DNA binding protein
MASLKKEVFRVSSEIKFLTIEDMAEMLQVTRTTIYNLKKKGLPFIKLGKNVRFVQDEVIEWVKSQKVSITDNSK